MVVLDNVFKMIHSFHIPVMGLAFTIDTPVKVAKYGISSVVSIIHDSLVENMRKHYCGEYNLPYLPISAKDHDYRARRITAYLNLLDYIVKHQFNAVIDSTFETDSELTKYFDLLPEESPLKVLHKTMQTTLDPVLKKELEGQLRRSIRPGAIDVNIMTKLDRTNYSPTGVQLPEEYCDALSALRGYANSTLSSSIVFSAGLNPRLFSYTENFEDFYPDANGEIKKKIIIKVSDYRSALIQGKFLAKKGLWVSEFRIESGLNCGGHAFATEGFLLGPILEEFKTNRTNLTRELHELFQKALISKNRNSFENPLPLKITYQGGVGTSEEHEFLLNYFNLDGVGWGSPFLLVPEATQVDKETLDRLEKAGKEDLYLSHSSPLGVPFNTLRNSSGQEQKRKRIMDGRPGSPCISKHLVSNTEFTEKPICTASRKYQDYKIEQLKSYHLPQEEYKTKYEQIVEKECLCEGLAASSLINAGLVKEDTAVSICPGPNLAFFSEVYSLKEMVDHIYGKINLLNTTIRPHVLVNELALYVDYLIKEVKGITKDCTEKQFKYLNGFKINLLKGVNYYKELVINLKVGGLKFTNEILSQLIQLEIQIESIVLGEAKLV